MKRGSSLFGLLGWSIGGAALGLAAGFVVSETLGEVGPARIKGLVREWFRQHQHELPAVDLVVNARAGARDADNAAITRSLERHWRTVVKQCAPS